MRKALILFIRAYRFCLSPFLVSTCRFYPTCSHYAETAIQRHGFIKGTGLAVKRISCCHPWHPGGVDEVPELEIKKN